MSSKETSPKQLEDVLQDYDKIGELPIEIIKADRRNSNSRNISIEMQKSSSIDKQN